MTLGAMDDLRESAHALAIGSRALDPLAQVGSMVLGFDATTPMISGTTIDTTRLPALAEPTAALHDALAATQEALAEVTGSGPLGRPVGAVAGSLQGTIGDLTLLAGAAEVSLPALPDALGEQEPKRYLICALNDAELFGSGGAPLFAVMVEAVRGSISHPALRSAGVEAVTAQPPDRVGACRGPAVAQGQQAVPVRQLELPPRLHRRPPWT